MQQISELFHLLLRNVYLFIDQPVNLFALLFTAAVANSFVPAVPLEAAALAAALLASKGHGSVPVIILSTSAGMTVGGLLLFFLARVYGPALLAKPPFNKLISPESYRKSSAWFAKYGVWTLFFGKLLPLPGMSFCTIVCCGALRLEIKKAAAGIFASNLIFFSAVTAVGLFAGEQSARILSYARSVWPALSVAVIILALLGAYFYLKTGPKRA